ncbi:MAG: DUF4870 domain-containing protein [Ardenticatenaceae bacterium]|nr:DUF4870 domain-containing protein [Ardenticatenaceae bacterium]MCB9445388.1 DUF4870 domain-containing protein [Ardenticatenaceae bacterium]
MTEEFEPTDGNEFEEKVPITEEPMSGMDGITDDDKLWAFLAYVFTPIVPIILMLMEDKKNRPFIKAHNAQALAWGIVNVIGGTILSSVLFFCLGAPSIIIWAVGVYWGWQAYQGQEVTIPFVTDFVKKQGWA